MILSYRNFRFNSGEVGTQIYRETVRNEAGDQWARRERWALDGMILNPGGSLATMKALIQAAETAFNADYGDLILYNPNGSTRSAHSLINGETIGGVRVVNPIHFPRSEGPEGVTFRSFSATLEAEKAVYNPDSLLQSWSEELQYSGGGPATEHLRTLYSKPIKYTAAQYTPYIVVQRGSAVGLYGYPTAPGPIWPDAEKRHMRVMTQGTPRPMNLRQMFWPISWQYTFESAEPLSGSPNRWPFRG